MMADRGRATAASLRRELQHLLPSHRLKTGGSIPRSMTVKPESVAELRQLVRIARENQVPIFPKGRRHSAVRPADLHIRADLSRLTRILEFNESSRLVTVQSGVCVQGISDWLAGKKMVMPVHSLTGSDVQLWEFLQQPLSEGYGPGTGTRDDLVAGFSAVLPDGGLMESSLSPRRATGPDVTRLLLRSGARLGLLAQVTLRVVPAPVRIARLIFASTTPYRLLDRLWDTAGEIQARSIQLLGYLEEDGRPWYLCQVTLWGEGSSLSRRRDRAEQALSDVADPVTRSRPLFIQPLEELQPDGGWCQEEDLDRHGLSKRIRTWHRDLKNHRLGILQVFGFAAGRVTVHRAGDGAGPGVRAPRPSMTDALAEALDREGTFAWNPALWTLSAGQEELL